MITAGLAIAGIGGLVLGKRHFNGGSCDLQKDLSGQIIIVTGANTGIGKETSKILAQMKATVILACRTP